MWTRRSGSRRRTPSAPAIAWPGTGSCWAAPPARSSAARSAGWPAMTPMSSPPWPSPRTWGSATSTPSTRPTGSRACTATTCSAPMSWPPGPRPSTRAPARLLTRLLTMAPATTVTDAGPATGTERSLAEVLAEVVRVERVSVDSHFFEDLGADSMVMAQFCARVRKRPELPSVSMKDVYRHPTIRSLATALAGTTSTPAGAPAPAPAEVPVGTARYVLCGALQALLPRLRLPGRVDHDPGLRLGLRQRRRARRLPAVGHLRRRDVPRHVHPPDPGQVGAHRPVEAPADPHLEPGLSPLLDREDAGPGQPGPVLRRFTALPALSAGAGGEHRARRGDPVQARARLHRPAHRRRRHGHPQGLVLHLLPGPRRPDPARRGHPGQGRAGQRVDGARHRDLDGRRGPARPCLLPAHRAGRPRRGALARVPGAAHRGGLPGGRPGRLRRLEKGDLQRPAAAAGAAPEPAAGLRRPGRAVHRGPVAGRARLRAPGPHQRSLLPRRPGHLLRALLRLGPGRPPHHRHRPAGAQPRHPAGQAVPAVRLPLRHPPDDRAPDQQPVLHRALR